jgi:hypothetical protein
MGCLHLFIDLSMSFWNLTSQTYYNSHKITWRPSFNVLLATFLSSVHNESISGFISRSFSHSIVALGFIDSSLTSDPRSYHGLTLHKIVKCSTLEAAFPVRRQNSFLVKDSHEFCRNLIIQIRSPRATVAAGILL